VYLLAISLYRFVELLSEVPKVSELENDNLDKDKEDDVVYLDNLFDYLEANDIDTSCINVVESDIE